MGKRSINKVRTLNTEMCKQKIGGDNRQSNIELLRIVAMNMIVIGHFSCHGGFGFPPTSITINRLWTQFIVMGGNIGVNIFMLISGYFLISSTTINIEKIIRQWLQIFTYSVLSFVVFVGAGIESFDLKEMIRHLFPITYSQWWFASVYFVLYLFSPFLNKLLNGLEKENYQRLLALMLFCWCIIPTFLSSSWQGSAILWFTFLYSLAGYIRRYSLKCKLSGQAFLGIAFFLMLMTFISTVTFDILGMKYAIFPDNALYFYDKSCIPVFLIAFMLFIGFLKIDIGYRALINKIAAASFGVYLISDDSYVRPFLWGTVFKNAQYAESDWLILYTVLVVAIVYVTCTVIDWCRSFIYGKCFLKMSTKVSERARRHIDNCFLLKIIQKV